MPKWIAMTVLGAGLIAGAASAVVWINGKDSIARAEANRAESEEAAALAAERKARSEAATAASQASAKAAEEKIATEKRLAAQADAEKARADAEKAAADLARSEAEKEKAAIDRERAQAEAAKAADERAAALAAKESAKAARDKAAAEAAAEASKAQNAADSLAREKLKSEKTIAEAKLLELRRLDLETLERELADFKRELDEREAALKPEKTIKDLAVYGTGDDLKSEKAAALPDDDDPAMPAETRALLKARREWGSAAEAVSALLRSNTVSRLEAIYKKALDEDRIVDADFIYRELKLMYPDWKYEP